MGAFKNPLISAHFRSWALNAPGGFHHRGHREHGDFWVDLLCLVLIFYSQVFEEIKGWVSANEGWGLRSE